jgi:hypothetical protein
MATYKGDYGAVGRWLRSSGKLRGACRARGNQIVSTARVIAPVRSGHYKATLHVRDSRGWDGRVAVDVVAPVPYATAVEHRHHVLARAGQLS